VSTKIGIFPDFFQKVGILNLFRKKSNFQNHPSMNSSEIFWNIKIKIGIGAAQK
jgi:hypothetical protein